MLLLLIDVIQDIGHSAQDLFLNAFDALLLVVGQIESGVQGISTAAVNFSKLCLIEYLLFRDETGPGGKVLLGARIVFLKVASVVKTCAVKVPVPGNKVDTILGRMSGQNRSVEISQYLEISRQPLSLQRGACSIKVMYSCTMQARLVARSQAWSRSEVATSSCQ